MLLFRLYFLRDIFSGYRILCWQYFSLNTLKILLHYHIICDHFQREITLIFIVVPVHIMHLYSTTAFKSLALVLSNSDYVYHWYDFLQVSYACNSLWSLDLWVCSLHQNSNILVTTSSISLLPSFWELYKYIGWLEVVPHSTDAVFLFLNQLYWDIIHNCLKYTHQWFLVYSESYASINHQQNI